MIFYSNFFKFKRVKYLLIISKKLDLNKSLIKLDKIILESYRQKGINYLVNNFTYKSKSHSLIFKTMTLI